MIRLFNILLISCGIMLPVFTLHAATPASADKIKAAYTYQFTKFVTWPDSSTSEKPFTICVFGDEPIGKQLEPLNKRKLGDRSIKVEYIEEIYKTDTCNILYISETESGKLNVIFRYLKNKPVLTVSSISDFALQGGIIGLVAYKKKIRLEINLASARRVDIILSAKLLEIAKVIESVKNKEEQP